MNDKQVMVITGTSKGLGRRLAEHYAKEGFRVIGCSRTAVEHHFDNYHHFNIDVSNEDSVKEMFSEIEKKYKRLDVLINNAGMAVMNYALLMPLKTVQDMVNTNFIGLFLCCREAIRFMQRGSYGRIVNISSIAVPLSEAGTSIYGASKAAGEQFVRALAREVISYGITVNTLALSFVKDGSMAGNINEKAIKEALSRTIFKSQLDFKDVASSLDFLISCQSRAVTGQTLYVGGI